MADNALSRIRNRDYPPTPRRKPDRYADIPGMYGYDAQGRPLAPPIDGQGGYKVEPSAQVIAQTKSGPIVEDTPSFDLATIPQGSGQSWQNVTSTPFNNDAKHEQLRQQIAWALNAPPSMGPALSGMADDLRRIQELKAQNDALRPQNDAAWSQQRAKEAWINNQLMPLEDKAMSDAYWLTPSNDTREFARPIWNKLSQIRSTLEQALGAPTWEDPLRGRTYNRNPQGLPPDNADALRLANGPRNF